MITSLYKDIKLAGEGRGFHKHRGRKGQVGGSLPRSAGESAAAHALPRGEHLAVSTVLNDKIDHLLFVWQPLPHTPLSTQAYKQIANVEEKFRTKYVEEGRIFDHDGNVIRRIPSGNHDSLPLTEFDLRRMENRIFSHNHPEGRTLSLPDVWIAIATNVQEIRATSAQHTYRIIRPDEGWPDSDEFVQVANDYHDYAYQQQLTSAWKKLKDIVGDIFKTQTSIEIGRKIMDHQLLLVSQHFKFPYYINYHTSLVSAAEESKYTSKALIGSVILDKDFGELIKRIKRDLRVKYNKVKNKGELA